MPIKLTILCTVLLSLLLTCSNTNAQSPAGCNPPSTPGPVTGPTSIVQGMGNTVSFCINSVPGATSYLWSVSPSSAGQITVNDTCVVINLDNNYDGDVCVFVAAENSCGTSLFTECSTFYVIAAGFSTLNPTGTYCATTDTFQLSTGIGGTVWTSTGNNISPDGVLSPTTPGTFTITATYTLNGEQGTVSQDITVNPAVNPQILVPSYICQDSPSFTLQANPQGGSFSPSNTVSTAIAGPSDYIYTINAPFGCSGADTATVNIEPLPHAQFSYTMLCNSVCFIDESLYAPQALWDFGIDIGILGPCIVYDTLGTYCVTLYVANACGEDDTTICITIDCLLSIDETTAVNNLSIYPNPTNGLVNVLFNSANAQNYMLNVIDVTGKTLYTEHLNNFVGQYNNPLDFSRFRAGIYIFRIVDEQGRSNNIKIVRH